MPWSKEKGVTCFICGAPVPVWCSVMWCDDCLDKREQSGLSIDEFIAQEKVNNE